MIPAWDLLRAASAAHDLGWDHARPGFFGMSGNGRLEPVARDCAHLVWNPAVGWTLPPQGNVADRDLLELYLPVCSAHAGRPIAVGHLGQSLDGYIATSAGDSYYVTGEENVRHLHRMRALCDAVIVGAGTIAADDPQLTTRHVPGKNPRRVVIDRQRRLDQQFRVFNDGMAPTVLVCGAGAPDPWPAPSQVELLRLPTVDGNVDLAALITWLHERGCMRLFIEGGGVTVSSFLRAGLLDRLQVTIAPLIIGEGRPALRLPPTTHLSECLRPHSRVFRMGGDMLFDCALAERTDHPVPATGIQRVS